MQREKILHMHSFVTRPFTQYCKQETAWVRGYPVHVHTVILSIIHILDGLTVGEFSLVTALYSCITIAL